MLPIINAFSNFGSTSPFDSSSASSSVFSSNACFVEAAFNEFTSLLGIKMVSAFSYKLRITPYSPVGSCKNIFKSAIKSITVG